MFVLKFLLGILLCLWIIVLWSRRRYYMLSLKVKTLPGLPIIGILYKIRSVRDIISFIGNYASENESPVITWMGPLPCLVIFDPETTEAILTSPKCLNKSLHYEAARETIGDGFVTISNPAWGTHRKLLNPAFSYEILRSFVSIFNEETKLFTNDLDETYKGDLLDMLPILKKLTYNIALQTTMGQNPHSLERSSFTKDSVGLFEHYKCLQETTMHFVIRPWLLFKWIRHLAPGLKMYKLYKEELRIHNEKLVSDRLEVVHQNRNENQNGTEQTYDIRKNKNNIFINIATELLRNGELTVKQVLDHSSNMLAAAFETSAATLTHILILLAMYPQYQEIAFEEICALFPDRDNITVGDEHLKELVYLEMVIYETLRLIPTVPIIGRTVDDDVEISDGVILPKGFNVIISIFELHRRTSIWGPDALVFNPENCLPDNIKQKHPFAFIPFTKGIRNCIGWRYGVNVVKISLSILLRKYRFSTTGKFEDLQYSSEISTVLVDPPLLKLHRREK